MAGLIARTGGGLARHALAGAIAGLVATWATATFMQKAPQAMETDPTAPDAEGEPQIGSPDAVGEAVDVISEEVTGDPVPQEDKSAAMHIFQFAFGTALGAAYGVVARVVPFATAGRGVLFGTGVWAGADEAAMPAVGLTGEPEDTPPATHAYMLGAHLVYGVVAETVRRLLVGRR